MSRHVKAPPPLEIQTVLANGKYILVFKRDPPHGAPENIRAGDVVSYRDENHARVTGEVTKVMLRVQKLRIAPHMWKEWVLRPGCFLKFAAVIEALRPVGAHRTSEMDAPPGAGALVPDLTPEVAGPQNPPAPKTGRRERKGSVPQSDNSTPTLRHRRRLI